MAPAAPESADTTSPDWLPAPSDSRNDLYDEDDSPSLDVLIDWFKEHSDNFNDRFEEIPSQFANSSSQFYLNSLLSSSSSLSSLSSLRSSEEDGDYELDDDFPEIPSAPIAAADSAARPRRGRPRKKIPPNAGTAITGTVPIAAADSAASPRRQRSHNDNLNPNGGIPCNYEGCGKTFRNNVYLRAHKRTHWPDRFHCEQCDYGSHWKSNLQSHLRRKHNPNPESFHCPQCNFKTTQGDNLRGHQKRQHGGM